MNFVVTSYNLTVRAKFTFNTVIKRFKTDKMKYLNVAEKNDAAKNIALHLSRGTSRRREGLSQYNKIYEFEAEVFGQNCQMVMTSVSGHLLSLEFVGTYKHWQACNPLSLFDAPVFKYCPENYEKIKKTLEREVKGCQGLIIWTDCDREGENIGFEIIQVCTAIKSNLKIYRAKFSEITAISVKRALNTLEQPNKNVSDAVDVRQELDLRIGAAFTRFQTLRLQKVFPSKLAESLVSYGSCQFPTLGFVVERYRAVENFVAEQFWKIKVNHTMNNLSVDFTWDRVRLFDRLACQVLHDMCLENPLATVTDVKTKPKSKWRPLPLDTVELEKLASRKLKINAKETMRLAEKLYTQGLISYPRTETNEYPKEMNLGQLVQFQTGDPNWGGFAQKILDNGGPNPRQGNKSDKAHPPIHPTKYASNLSGNEQRLYEFIVRSFLACVSQDAKGQETTVNLNVAEEKFSASGLMITERNYLEVYPYDKWSSKEIHVYENGQTFNPTSIDFVDGSTSPPNLLTEADLIALMEKHGIGTDATHAEHIETIKSRSYVALADAIHFVPGLLGMGLVEGYDAMGLTISKPHLRAQLESDLKDISEGRKLPNVVLAEQIARYKEVYVTVTSEATKIDEALGARFCERPAEYVCADVTSPQQEPVIKCPKCGADMTLRQRKNSSDLFISCMMYPNCKNAVWLPSLVRSVEILNSTCSTCGPNFKKLKFQWKNNSLSHLYPPPYEACIGGCDSAFLEVLNINLANVRKPSENRSSNTNIRTNNILPRQTTLNFSDNTVQNTNNINRVPSSSSTVIRAQQSTNQVNRLQQNTNQVNRLQQSNSSNMVVRNTNNALPLPNGNPEENDVSCACNKQAILLTVRKQNANFGKKFYKCPVGKENGGCDFFLWAPESVQNEQTTTSSNSNTGQGWSNSGNTGQSWNNNSPTSGNTTRGWGIAPSRDSYPANDDNTMCNCGLPGKKVTVNKEGPNKGRPFYGCPKEFNARCNFFQWADDAPSTGEWQSSSRGGRSRGRGRGRSERDGTSRGERDGTSRGRRCGLCKREGHTRNRCPDRE